MTTPKRGPKGQTGKAPTTSSRKPSAPPKIPRGYPKTYHAKWREIVKANPGKWGVEHSELIMSFAVLWVQYLDAVQTVDKHGATYLGPNNAECVTAAMKLVESLSVKLSSMADKLGYEPYQKPEEKSGFKAFLEMHTKKVAK